MADIVFHDLDIYGRTDAQGGILVHEQDKAIANALVAFLTSRGGDYIYQPSVGGVLDAIPFKLMTGERSKQLKSFFNSVITDKFGGVTRLESVNVVSNEVTKTYKIGIEYTSLLTNNKVLVNFNTKQKPADKVVTTFVDVPYTGDNLLNFVLLHLIELPGVPLKKDDSTGVWVWGSWRLINLQDTQPEFAEIFDLTRGV